MKIPFPSFNLNAEILHEAESGKYLFLLHGFTGSSKEWGKISEELISGYNVIAIDLPGHGRSDCPGNPVFYSHTAICTQLHRAITAFTDNKIILLGYSMGGRAALSFAFNFPQHVEALILESSSPGLKSRAEREDRKLSDEELADFIEQHTIEEFADYWMNLDLFNTQRRFSAKKRKELRETKIENNRNGLINSLRGFGTGVMPSYWNDLADFQIRTLLISGELDPKYTSLSTEMAGILPNVSHKIITSAGHNTHLEEPKKFVNEINMFLSSF